MANNPSFYKRWCFEGMFCCIFHVGFFFQFHSRPVWKLQTISVTWTKIVEIKLMFKIFPDQMQYLCYFFSKTLLPAGFSHVMPLILTWICVFTSFSLEETSMALEEWLSAQEGRVKEIDKDDAELENVYETLLMQRYWVFWSLRTVF